MGGVRNGNSLGAQTPADARLEPQPGPESDVDVQVGRHLQAAAALLREGSAPRAFGELVRASRALPMTRRMAAALVTYSLKAGTEAAAIMVLGKAVDSTDGALRRDVRRQLARVLRRVDQLPRAMEVLDAILGEEPSDRRALRMRAALLARVTGPARAPAPEPASAPEQASAPVQSPEARASEVEAPAPSEASPTVSPAPLVASEDREAVVPPVEEAASPAVEEAASPAVEVAAPQSVEAVPPRVDAAVPPPVEAADAGAPAQESPLPPLEALATSEQGTPGAGVDAAAAADAFLPPLGLPEASEEAVADAGALPVVAGVMPAAEEPSAEEPPVVAGVMPAAEEPPVEEPPVVAGVMPPAEEPEAAEPRAPEVEAVAAVDASPPPVAEGAAAPEQAAVDAGADVHPVAESEASVEQAPERGVDAGPVEVLAGSPDAAEPELPTVRGSEDVQAGEEVESSAAPATAAPAAPLTDVVELPASELAAPPEPPPAPVVPVDLQATKTMEFAAVAPEPSAPAPRAPFSATKTIEFSLEDLGGQIVEPDADAREPATAPVAAAPTVEVAPLPPEPALPVLTAPVFPLLTPEPALPVSGLESALAVAVPSESLVEASETPAPAAPPVRPREPDPEVREARAAMQRLEAQLIARKRWRELAQLYLERADIAEDTAERVEVLTRLAELLEDELQDVAGAARTYGEIAQLTGDRAALKEQVRLLGLRGDDSLVERALDEAVKRGATPAARSAALVMRAERALAAGQLHRAWTDFNAADALTPGTLPVLAGLVRSAADPSRAALLAVRLRDLLQETPRRAPERLEALRRLAEAGDSSLRNPRLASWAWTEVLGEEPEDAQARARLVALARDLKDAGGLARLLREQLSREPRGPAAREARLELVATLEAGGDAEGALAELRQAVRMEPGHKQAWLRLVERLTARGLVEEAAWAQEHAATATEDELERMHAWARLGAYCRDVLKDAARAQVFSTRAENMRRGREERGLPTGDVAAAAPSPPPPAPAPAPPQPEQVALGDEDFPVPPTSILSWEAPPGRMEPSRRRARPQTPPAPPPVLRPAEKPAASAPPPPPPATPALSEPAALKLVRERPLEAGLYRVLAEGFHARGQTERGELMQEVADALDGRETAPPRPPRVLLNAEDRAGLRHPGLRTPSGELFAVVGLALCRLFPAYGPAAGTNISLMKELGPGAPAAVRALEEAATVLKVRLPDIVLSEESGPPFSAVHASAPRLLVGKLAVQQALPAAELRFHAGRALFCLTPDLLALRSLKKDQLLRGLSFLSAVLYEEEGEAPGPEGRVLRDSLPPKARERAAALLEPGMRNLDIPALAEAARHSANRAGLVACGGVGPALAVLRSRKALEQEVVELVRFAASERYLQLRLGED